MKSGGLSIRKLLLAPIGSINTLYFVLSIDPSIHPLLSSHGNLCIKSAVSARVYSRIKHHITLYHTLFLIRIKSTRSLCERCCKTPLDLRCSAWRKGIE